MYVKFVFAVRFILLNLFINRMDTCSLFLSNLLTYNTINRRNHRIDILKILCGIFIFKITTIDNNDILRLISLVLESIPFYFALQ